MTTHKSSNSHVSLKLRCSKVKFKLTVFHMRQAINVINNQWGYILSEQKLYIRTVCGFIHFGQTATHFKSAQVPAVTASRFVYVFPLLKKKKKKKKKSNYRCCHPLTVLLLALMDNVKGAQPCWVQADMASVWWPSHKTDVYCFSRDDLLCAQYWLRSKHRSL